jgi:hypothetical protein
VSITPTPDDLLTLAAIADMNHCSMRHARDVIVRLVGFPEEAPTSTPRNRLWIRIEVKAYSVHRKLRKPARIPQNRLQAA